MAEAVQVMEDSRTTLKTDSSNIRPPNPPMATSILIVFHARHPGEKPPQVVEDKAKNKEETNTTIGSTKVTKKG